MKNVTTRQGTSDRALAPAAPGWKPGVPMRAKPNGLGDLVAQVAQPIAALIDAVAGTRLKTCGGCAQRKARLNRLVPDIARPTGMRRPAP